MTGRRTPAVALSGLAMAGAVCRTLALRRASRKNPAVADRTGPAVDVEPVPAADLEGMAQLRSLGARLEPLELSMPVITPGAARVRELASAIAG